MDSDETTRDPAEGEEPCCGGECKCGMDQEVAPDDLALISLITGVMSIFLVMGFPAHRLIGLFCAATAMVCGWHAQRAQSRREKQAIAGLVCGSIGLTFWLLGAWGPQLVRLFTG